MKKSIILLTALLMWGTFPAAAGNGTNPSKSISKQLQLPAYLKTQKLNEKVNVQFKVVEGGNVILTNVSTTHPELKKYIQQAFPKINVSELKPEETYFIDINFKVL